MSNKKVYEESSLVDRLWPDKAIESPATENPHWNDLPLSYRLWPDKTWPLETKIYLVVASSMNMTDSLPNSMNKKKILGIKKASMYYRKKSC